MPSTIGAESTIETHSQLEVDNTKAEDKIESMHDVKGMTLKSETATSSI